MFKTLLFSLLFPLATFASTHIVYIGDSHSVGVFGQEIDQWLRKRPDTEFKFFASGGTAPFQWLHGTAPIRCMLKDDGTSNEVPRGICAGKGNPSFGTTPKFETMLNDQAEKRIAIIAHGTNYGTKTEAQFKEQVETTVQLIRIANQHQYQCYWIGPPQMSKYNGVALETKYSVIQTAMKKAVDRYGAHCTLIDSRALTRYPASRNLDGIHYTFPGGSSSESIKITKEWAQKVISQLP